MNGENDSKNISSSMSTLTNKQHIVDHTNKNKEGDPKLEKQKQESTTKETKQIKKDKKSSTKIHYPNGYLSRNP